MTKGPLELGIDIETYSSVDIKHGAYAYSEAPDFAGHVDIHNKPGYDPKELFFFNRGEVRGTHGRKCEIAQA